MQFIKKNIKEARGFQKSRYDSLLEHFVEPGDSLMFDEAELTRAAASQAVKRLMILDPSRKFHSFYNVLEKKVCIRVRPAGEIPDVEEKEVESEETDVPEPEAVDLHEKQDTIEFP